MPLHREPETGGCILERLHHTVGRPPHRLVPGRRLDALVVVGRHRDPVAEDGVQPASGEISTGCSPYIPDPGSASGDRAGPVGAAPARPLPPLPSPACLDRHRAQGRRRRRSPARAGARKRRGQGVAVARWDAVAGRSGTARRRHHRPGSARRAATAPRARRQGLHRLAVAGLRRRGHPPHGPGARTRREREQPARPSRPPRTPVRRMT